MKKILLLAVVLGLLVSALATDLFAGGNKKLAFRDIYLRQPIEDANEFVQEYGFSIYEDVDYVTIEGDKTVQEIRVTTYGEKNDRFKDAVFKKYGKPNYFKITHWQNNFGAKWEGFESRWDIGKDIVWLLFGPGERGMMMQLSIETFEYSNKNKKGDMKF